MFAAGDYKIYKEDITTALKDIGLIITSDVHQPAMGSSCPLLSNKMITAGHSPGAYLTDWRCANDARGSTRVYMAKKSDGEDRLEEEPHLIQLRYKVYGDGML